MHELFTQVLSKKDLSKAGDLFSVSDQAIVNDLTEVVNTISDITSLPDYVNNDNDQSVVEICITRVTSAIRETGSVEQHAEALVTLLESCLNHNLKPSARDEDPPHAKISSDIISCIFLHYSKKEVMRRALPVAVKFLHKGNKELSRNMSSYLSLAAIDNADLLSKHIQLIIDSIISGNYPLCRVLPQLYTVNTEPLHDHAMALVSLLPQCDTAEKLALLSLFALIAKNSPQRKQMSTEIRQFCIGSHASKQPMDARDSAEISWSISTRSATNEWSSYMSEYLKRYMSKQLLEPSLPQLCEYLTTSSTAGATMQVLLDMASRRPQSLIDYVPRIKQAAEGHPSTLCLAAQIISSVGKLSKDQAEEALNFVLEHLPKADRGSQGTLLREATLLCSSFPVLFTERMLAEVRQCSSGHREPSTGPAASAPTATAQVNQTCGGVTIVKVGGSRPDLQAGNLAAPAPAASPPPAVPVPNTWLSRQEVNRLVIGRPRAGEATRAPGRLQASAAHRSMTRLNVGGSRTGSVGGLHKSMTRLSSSQQINLMPAAGGRVAVSTGAGAGSQQAAQQRVSSGGVTVTTASPNKSSTGSGSVLREDLTLSISTAFPATAAGSSTTLVQTTGGGPAVGGLSQSGGRLHVVGAGTGRGTLSSSGSLAPPPPAPPPTASHTLPAPVVTARRHHNTSVTLLNSSQSNAAASQRISVFEPYPMRDTVQHFCEKHLDKIKSYMEKMSVRIPPPAKCTIEERRAKKLVKLHFACQGRGEHCLYSRTFFTMKTRNPRVWIHLMFIALQARSESALSSRDASVSSLKNCWDILKCENKTFLTLVTSAFPCTKEQDALLAELRCSGFFDVFERASGHWGCFLCTHPERALGLLQDGQPVIEGQLKEKKGRWRLFRRWRTRYFTLSGAHLSYKGSKDDKDVTPIEVNQIRSVKVSRGARNIPKAFEIFTGDQSLILKPKGGKNAEEWVQCLSIVVAHSHSREVPAKSNSLPARGASLRTAV